ncbi:MAG: VWA domain-containing protein [Acidobacteriaceae bacterium]|nr:VWA domain-containing protein [Acidobacteriaceae bacterium]
MWRQVAWVLAVAVAVPLWAQDEKPKVGDPVSVPFLVRDKKGEPVTGLNKDNFAIKVDGTAQPVRSVTLGATDPILYGLVVDVGKGERDNIDRVQRAAHALVKGLRPGDRMFLVQFAKQIELLQEPTADKAALERSLNLLGTSSPSFHPRPDGPEVTRDSEGRRSESGGTSLNDAVYLSCEEVMSREKVGRRVLLVASDGVDIHSKKSSTEVVESIERTRTVVYTAFLPSKQEPGAQTNRNGSRNGSGNGNGRPSIGGLPGSYPGGGGGYPGSGYPGSGSPSGGGSNPNGTGQQKPNTGDERQHRPNIDGTQVLAKMSRASGGRLLSEEKHTSLEEQFASVSDDLAAMYWVEITPLGKASRQAYHSFDFVVTGPDKSKKVEVQTPDGYYAGS